MIKSIIILMGLALIGCQADPEQVYHGNVDVHLITKADGCSVYRFHDGGYPHYFVKCENSAMTSEARSCGKNCHIHEEIQTENVNEQE